MDNLSIVMYWLSNLVKQYAAMATHTRIHLLTSEEVAGTTESAKERTRKSLN